jgi:hypothetical protein
VEPDPYTFRACGEKWYEYREKTDQGHNYEGGEKAFLQQKDNSKNSKHCFVTI